MGIFDRDLEPPVGQEQIADKDGTPTLKHFTQQQRLWEWVVAGFITIPCDVSGDANAIVLTPIRRPDRGASGYTHLLPFSFVAGATSTGAATIQVKRNAQFTLDAIPAYVGAVAVGAGDVVAGVPYLGIYCDAVAALSLPARIVLK